MPLSSSLLTLLTSTPSVFSLALTSNPTQGVRTDSSMRACKHLFLRRFCSLNTWSIVSCACFIILRRDFARSPALTFLISVRLKLSSNCLKSCSHCVSLLPHIVCVSCSALCSLFKALSSVFTSLHLVLCRACSALNFSVTPASVAAQGACACLSCLLANFSSSSSDWVRARISESSLRLALRETSSSKILPHPLCSALQTRNCTSRSLMVSFFVSRPSSFSDTRPSLNTALFLCISSSCLLAASCFSREEIRLLRPSSLL
mmetsp:Transcript_7718/g.14671  ORF Transcript_7718/g.14671 Transcript_7718/m.14671 type:complete len:261 (-) Transcript_7718:44-826(-)